MSTLPYRRNVGAVLFNRAGRVFVARRADLPNVEGPAGGWQLPQGGIDADEDPHVAIFRELAEEIGTANAELLAEHPGWLTYDLPSHLVGVALGGKYRGQTQKWFALRFLGRKFQAAFLLVPSLGSGSSLLSGLGLGGFLAAATGGQGDCQSEGQRRQHQRRG